MLGIFLICVYVCRISVHYICLPVSVSVWVRLQAQVCSAWLAVLADDRRGYEGKKYVGINCKLSNIRFAMIRITMFFLFLFINQISLYVSSVFNFSILVDLYSSKLWCEFGMHIAILPWSIMTNHHQPFLTGIGQYKSDNNHYSVFSANIE